MNHRDAALGYSSLLSESLYSREVICSETSPTRKMVRDVVKRRALMFVNLPSVVNVYP
jgi:hypothetical protein